MNKIKRTQALEIQVNNVSEYALLTKNLKNQKPSSPQYVNVKN